MKPTQHLPLGSETGASICHNAVLVRIPAFIVKTCEGLQKYIKVSSLSPSPDLSGSLQPISKLNDSSDTRFISQHWLHYRNHKMTDHSRVGGCVGRKGKHKLLWLNRRNTHTHACMGARGPTCTLRNLAHTSFPLELEARPRLVGEGGLPAH